MMPAVAPDDADDPIPRLARIMRQLLGAQTDGEHLAALAAFRRAIEAAGLDLHDIVGRFESAGSKEDLGGAPARAFDDREFSAAAAMAAQYSDDLWPDLAKWLCQQDDAWHAAHRRWLLNGTQRRFVEDQREAALSVRPTLRQAAWLIALADKVTGQIARPEPPRPEQIALRPRSLRAGDRIYAERVVPTAQPKRQPQRVTGRKDQVAWICAVVAAQRQGNRPTDDPAAPALFSDAEARALTWLAAKFAAWVIDRSASGKDDLVIDHPHSAAAVAAGAQVSLRTVRRALAKARAAGYLDIERRGSGRGKPTVYRLALPPARLRHDHISRAQPRRQAQSRAR